MYTYGRSVEVDAWTNASPPFFLWDALQLQSLIKEFIKNDGVLTQDLLFQALFEAPTR